MDLSSLDLTRPRLPTTSKAEVCNLCRGSILKLSQRYNGFLTGYVLEGRVSRQMNVEHYYIKGRHIS